MKKIILALVCVMSPLCALPLGNPMDASLYKNGLFWENSNECSSPCDPCFRLCEAWSLRLGFYGDFVFDRHMKQNDVIQSPAKSFMISTSAGSITLNFCDRIDFFTTLGASNIQYGGTQNAATSPTFDWIAAQGAFAWSVGSRLTLWECDCFYLGIEGQYARSSPPLQEIIAGSGQRYFGSDNVRLHYTEWQVGLGLAYFIPFSSGVSVIPYTGVKWAHARGIWEHADLLPVGFEVFNLKNNKNWGWVFGATLFFCETATVSVEGRWADESAVSLNIQFRL